MIKLRIRSRADLDIEGMKVSVDEMGNKKYSEYCQTLWVPVEDVISRIDRLENHISHNGFDWEQLDEIKNELRGNKSG